MAKRTRIGLIFSYNEDWIAGAYYILNIIHALKTVDKEERPHIVIISEKKENYDLVISETNYPYLSFFKFGSRKSFTLTERIINKLGQVFLNRKLIEQKIVQPKIEFLYPKEVESIGLKGLARVNWIPDFQEEFLPHFFSEKEVRARKKYQEEVVCRGDIVVFSSKNAQAHYNKLYPSAEAKQFVLPFAVTHPDYSKQKIEDLLNKYNLPENYFFVPNQFWAHKNHRIILDAVKHIKDQGKDIFVAFSGRENDYRNKDYVDSLKTFINENELENNIRLLGFLDRKEQLCLMNKAIAIIQPSLFEGWSTVVEDAKALKKHIVLSNIDVHKEQISQGVTFFNPENSNQLIDILLDFQRKKPKMNSLDYKNDLRQFGKKIMDLVNLAS